MTEHAKPDTPPDSGKRPSLDRSGEVHGSGVGAGGASEGEDFDDDPATGDGGHGVGEAEKRSPAADRRAG